MADIARMESALRNADAAGDTAAAKQIANALKAARAGAQPAPERQVVNGIPQPMPGEDHTQHRAKLEEEKLRDLSKIGTIGGFNPASAIANGVTFGFADEISSAINTPFRAIRDQVGLREGYDRELALQNAQRDEMEAQAPVMSTVGEIAGGIATGAGLAKSGLTLAGRAAGRGLGARAAAGVAEGAAYGAAYGAGNADQGERVSGATQGAALGAAAGGILPIAGAGISAAGRKAKSAFQSAASPRKEARDRIMRAMTEDAPELAGRQIDEATALRNQQPIVNADRGGETVRGLARAAANADPATRSKLAEATQTRFGAQGDRVVSMIKRVAGGDVDDLAMQDAILNQARASNAKAYGAAMNAPEAQQVFTPKLQQILQSPAVQKAVRTVPEKSANRTLNPIKNPFERNSRGNFVLRRKADGSLVAPNLGFWDQVKINLDDQIGSAQRAGERSTAADLINLKSQIVDELDSIVPAYKQARAGAAAAFGAEDAIDAGRRFAKASRNTPEMMRALNKMTKAEKVAFRTGFASELVDKAKSSNDRMNVVRSMFQTQESREKLTATFGKARAAEMEAFVRIEIAMDSLRQAVSGNSTTTRQLMELGLIGGANTGAAGYGMATGDFRVLAATGALTGYRYGKQRIDDNVVKEIGKILASNDPSKMQRAATNASISPKYLNALRAVTDKVIAGQGAASGVLVTQ